MTFNIHCILAFMGMLLFTASTERSTVHPMKLTSSEIKYDVASKSIQMKCNVFIDDFTPVINNTMFIRAKQVNLTEEDKKGIEQYFQAKYRIYINNRQLSLSFKSYSIEQNVQSLHFV
ncbi:MAG: DUF6702 family protein, partial [Bacteroidota bacterium]